jgi:hypothetical protein
MGRQERHGRKPMSDNYRQYPEKMREQKAARASAPASQPLRDQLEELFETVRWCERIWAIEERIEKSR